MSQYRETIDLLSKTVRRLRTIYDRRAAMQGLTLARLRVLLRLGENEGLSQSDLAQLLQIEAPTLKRQIDALVKQGYVERRPVPGGGRARALHLTEAGRSSALSEFSRTTRERVLEGVSTAEMITFLAVLHRINTNLAKLDQE